MPHTLLKSSKARVVGLLLGALCSLGFASRSEAQPVLRGMNVSWRATTQDIIDLNALLNPSVVRFQIIFSSAVDNWSEEEYFTQLNAALANLDVLLPTFEQTNIKVILDLHTPPGGFESTAPPLPQLKIFARPWAQAAVINIWDQIAQRYKNNSTIIGYELVSEPATGKRPAPGLQNWYKLSVTLADTVRKYDKVKYLVISPEFANPAKLNKVKLPSRLGNKVYYGINVYTPITFLRQGVELAPYKTTFLGKKNEKNAIVKYLKKARDWQLKTKKRIFIPEFTTSRFAKNNTGAIYLQTIISIFESYKWSWTYLDWRDALPWSVEHSGAPGDTTKSPTITDRALVLQKFFKKGAAH